MRLEDFINAVNRKAPPAPADRLAAFERELGLPLPEDYRRFLVTCNGGHVGGRLWFRGPTPDGSTADAGVHHIGGFREESYFSLQSARDAYRGRIPNDLLWIMDDPFGNAICLAIRGPRRGCVYFWDHELEPDPGEWDGAIATASNLQLLAQSFTDFVSGLRPPPEE